MKFEIVGVTIDKFKISGQFVRHSILRLLPAFVCVLLKKCPFWRFSIYLFYQKRLKRSSLKSHFLTNFSIYIFRNFGRKRQSGAE